tara:strand:+ start:413 stop:724 length:312 start_codon:yes stop_codon:yes gene_type:complete
MNEVEKWFNDIEVQDIEYKVSQIFREHYNPHTERTSAICHLQRTVVDQWLYGVYNKHTVLNYDEIEGDKTFYTLPKGKEYICVHKDDRPGVLELKFTYKGADE